MFGKILGKLNYSHFKIYLYALRTNLLYIYLVKNLIKLVCQAKTEMLTCRLCGCIIHYLGIIYLYTGVYYMILTVIKLKLFKQILISLYIYFNFCTFCGNYFENNLL